MTAQVSVASGLDSTAKLRSSLISITPIRTKETIRHCGMNFSVVKTEYKIPEKPESFDDYAKLQYAMVFNNIEIPERFEVDDLIDFFTKRAIEKYNDDEEYQIIMKRIDKKITGTLSNFLDMMSLFKERYNTSLDDKINNYVSSVYDTDIPFNILSTFVRSIKMNGMFLNYLDNLIYSYNIRLSSNITRSNYRREGLLLSKMRDDVNKLFDIADPLFFNDKCLKLSLIVWNAINYANLEDTEVINFSDVPKHDFNRIFIGLKNNISTLRKYILNSPFGRGDRGRNVIFPEVKYAFTNDLNPAIIND